MEGEVQMVVVRPREAQKAADQLTVTITNNITNGNASDVHVSQQAVHDLAKLAQAENPFEELRRIVLDGQRVWTVETTLRRIGSRTLSFRSRSTPLDPYMGDDAKQFGPGTNAPITVVGKNIVDVSSTDCAMIKLNDSGWYDYQYYWDGHRLRNDWYLASVDLLLISFGAPDNARYVQISIRDRNGRRADTRGYFRDELGLPPL